MRMPNSFPTALRMGASWLCACWFPASALLAQQNLTMSGNVTSGTVACQAVNSITTDQARGFNVSGGASVKCEAGGTITLLPGFHAVAGSSNPTFEAFIVSQAVAPALTSPALGTGPGTGGPALSPQTFVFTFSDPLGAGDVNSFQASFGGTGAQAGICSLSYSGGVLGCGATMRASFSPRRLFRTTSASSAITR